MSKQKKPIPQDSNTLDQLSKLQADLEAERSKKLQAMADLENFRRRMESERAAFGAMANMGLIQQFLEIADDIQLALADENLNLERSKQALSNARSKLQSAAESAGVEVLPVSPGDEFLSAQMEAIATAPSSEMIGKVVAVVSSGYKLKGREEVLRPAKVVVGK